MVTIARFSFLANGRYGATALAMNLIWNFLQLEVFRQKGRRVGPLIRHVLHFSWRLVEVKRVAIAAMASGVFLEPSSSVAVGDGRRRGGGEQSPGGWFGSRIRAATVVPKTSLVG